MLLSITVWCAVEPNLNQHPRRCHQKCGCPVSPVPLGLKLARGGELASGPQQGFSIDRAPAKFLQPRLPAFFPHIHNPS